MRNEGMREWLHRNYLLTILAGGLFILVNFVMLSFGPAYMLTEGWNTFFAGLQNSLFSLFCVLFRFYFAPLADYKGRKRMMQLGASGFVAGTALFYLSNGSFAVVVLARAAMGVGMAAYLSAASCYVSEMVPARRRGIAIGVQRSIYSLALMTGPLGAAQMVASPLGYDGLFLTLCAVALVALVLVSFTRDAYQPVEGGVRLRAILSDYLELLQERRISVMFLLILVVCFGYGAVLSYGAIYLGDIEGIANVGLYFTFYSLGGLIGNITGGFASDRFSVDRAALGFAMLSGAGNAILFAAPQAPYAAMFLSGILGGTGFSAALAVIIHWIVDTVPARAKGTALGLQESCMDGGIALGSFVFGALTALLTLRTIFLVAGLAGVLIPIWIIQVARRAASNNKEEEQHATRHHH